MEDPSLAESIDTLAVAGEQAGFTVEIMIQLLSAGHGHCPTEFALIGWQLDGREHDHDTESRRKATDLRLWSRCCTEPRN
jgi:hypothetical protein